MSAMPKKIQEDATVVALQTVALQTCRMRLHAPATAALARPGQFAMVQVRDGFDPLLRRPLSFHAIDAEAGTVDLLFRIVGRGTWRLAKARPDTRIGILGPLGNGFSPPPPDGRPAVLVAGGIGIAPLYELIRRLACDREFTPAEARMHLFYGARTAAEFIPSELLDFPGLTVHRATDDGTSGHHGTVTRLLEAFTAGEGLRPSALYACGPLAMQYHVARWALANDVPSQLSLESLMACGIGACLGCALPARDPDDPDSAADRYVHVCKDGPIFPAGSIQWNRIQSHRANPPIFPYD